MIEQHLLASAFHSRDSCKLIISHLQPEAKNRKDERYSPEFRIILSKVDEYYTRDPAVHSVEQGLFLSIIEQAVHNDKHKARFKQVVEEAYAIPTSTVNTDALIREAMMNEIGDKLAVKLVNREDVGELIEEYTHLKSLQKLEDMTVNEDSVLGMDTLRDNLAFLRDKTGTFRLRPPRLNEAVEGGAMEGHTIIVYGRPEIAKSALCITNAAGWAMDGRQGIYFINEDQEKLIQLRLLSCITGLTKAQIDEDNEAALNMAERRGFGNITVIALRPGTLLEMEAYVDKYGAEWVVLDQLRNISVKSENRTGQLEAAARGTRDMAGKKKFLLMNVTQAGDSATDKAVLEQGDVDSSNTGIPGACDVMIGVGGTKEQVATNVRTLSLAKNKISGDHSAFPVRINPFISRYSDA